MKKIFLKRIINFSLSLCLISSFSLNSKITKANTNNLTTENIVYLKNKSDEMFKSNYFTKNYNDSNNELTIKYVITDEIYQSKLLDDIPEPIQKSEKVKLINEEDLQKDYRASNNIVYDNTIIWVDIEYLNDNSTIKNLIDLFNNGNKIIFVGEKINEYEELIAKTFNFTNVKLNQDDEDISQKTLMPMGFSIEKLNDGSTHVCGINVEVHEEESEVLGALLSASQSENLNDDYLLERNKQQSLTKAVPSTSRSGHDDWRTAKVEWDLYIDNVGFTNRNPRYQVHAITKVLNRNELDPSRYLVRGLNQLDLRIDDMGNNKIRMQNVKPAEKDEKFVNLDLGFGYSWSPEVSLSFGVSIKRDATRITHTAGGRDYPYFAANFWPVGHFPPKYQGGIGCEVENRGPASMPIKMSYTIEMFYMDIITNEQHFARGSEYWTWRSDW